MKLRGEFGPVYLERARDKDGEVTGYVRVSAVKHLADAHQIDTYAALPDEFQFKAAALAYGRAPDPTNKFLLKCIGLGLLRKIAHGRYQKAPDLAT
jgi:hypothetical protein